jgi:hypothetical protein
VRHDTRAAQRRAAGSSQPSRTGGVYFACVTAPPWASASGLPDSGDSPPKPTVLPFTVNAWMKPPSPPSWRGDQDRDLVADMDHVARVARTVEVARAVAFEFPIARALRVRDLDDRRGVRVRDVEFLDHALDGDALAEIELRGRMVSRGERPEEEQRRGGGRTTNFLLSTDIESLLVGLERTFPCSRVYSFASRAL